MRCSRGAALAGWALFAAAIGCNRGGGGAAAPAQERIGDAIRIEAGSPRLAFLKIEPVEESDNATLVALTGKVAFDEEHTQRVSSPIDGRVTAILVKPGDKVKAGQPLVELSSPTVGQVLADAQKALQDLNVAQKALDRAAKLRADGAISEKEVAQVEADFKKARSDVARTSAQLHSLGISPSDPTPNASLWAQLPGVVVERNVLVGQEVRADAAQALLTITSLDSVWVLADVYEQDLGLVQDGAAVAVHVPAYPEESFAGVVSHIGEVVDSQTRTVKIRCIVPNPQHRLKPEMFAKIDLQNHSGNKVLLIPVKAVLYEGEVTKVIVATSDRLFRLRRVYVGPQVGDKVRVLSGLSRGDKVVSDGALFLKKDIEAE